jgi:preprotein translocase subunit SecA
MQAVLAYISIIFHFVIDKARTPMIIVFGIICKHNKELRCIRTIINMLQPKIHYDIDENKNKCISQMRSLIV